MQRRGIAYLCQERLRHLSLLIAGAKKWIGFYAGVNEFLSICLPSPWGLYRKLFDLEVQGVAIPPFNEHGWLPDGIHDCTLEEVGEQLGVFQSSDRRPELWARFTEFVREAKACGLLDAVLIDGSFVTAEPVLNDIDLVLIVSMNHDFSVDLSPVQYNLLAQQRVRRRFGFDIVVVRNGSENLEQAVAFFQQVRQQPGAKKGILRIQL